MMKMHPARLEYTNSGTRLTIKILRESDAQVIGVVEIDADRLPNLLTGSVEVRAAILNPEELQTHVETQTLLVECPALDEASPEAAERTIAEVLRGYERQGWKGNSAHLLDRHRVRRVLPDGRHLYEVEFTRVTHTPRAAEEPSAVQ